MLESSVSVVVALQEQKAYITKVPTGFYYKNLLDKFHTILLSGGMDICDGCFKIADLLRVNNLVLIMGFYSGPCLPPSDGVASVVACPLGLGSSSWKSLPASQLVL